MSNFEFDNFDNFTNSPDKSKEFTELDAQRLKNERKRVKLKEEIWRQNRKDRRAYMEFIASANTEINTIHNILATRKNTGNVFGDSHKKELEDRISDAFNRIMDYEMKINQLTKKIEISEKELLN